MAARRTCQLPRLLLPDELFSGLKRSSQASSFIVRSHHTISRPMANDIGQRGKNSKWEARWRVRRIDFSLRINAPNTEYAPSTGTVTEIL
ncbi:hypothetical protein EW146_g4218 [Bondarzewia mesenterica]|uniref:Uncharacterized protein n=1 Tax=Bondarzewia mesenterica TaxID=1095465 RepID=A0A4S4LVD6_9AGAM|nr:hypothetical protein EW146_g4218 [Bondarzewia mesenterica]